MCKACSSSTSQELSSSHQESGIGSITRGEFFEQQHTTSSPILLTVPLQSATSPSRDNYEKADKGKDPPASPKFQESVDSVDSNIASVEVELCSIDVDEMVNELAKEASFEINREELNSIEAEETADQLANEASREINREELSSVEQGETIEANETNCEIHTDMNDPAQYIHSIEKLDLATKKRLISRGPFQPKAHEMNEKQFPKSRCGSHDCSFNESWYNIKVGKNNFKRKWLSYSPKDDAVFCHFCIFFSRNNKEQTFTKIGYRDWKKANEKFAKHEKSQCHIDATVDFTNFCSHIHVHEQLSNEATKVETARQEKVRKNREVMKRLIDVTLCLAQQGMAFRGHREVDEQPLFAEEEVLDKTCTGNFHSVVNPLAKYDAPLTNHLRAVRNSKLKRKRKPTVKTKGKRSRSGRGNVVSFMSADSQNKIINSIGSQLQKVIVGEINAAGMYSIAMDCTTDSSHADQLSIIIRYLNKTLDIVERLVSIQRVKDSSAQGLFNTLKEILKESSLSLDDAVGQSYDGASVMTGKYKGVKTLVQQANPQCLFIWTFDHVLNLVIMEACGSSLAAKSLFGALEKLYAFFSQSRKRSDILEEKQKESNIQQIHRPQRLPIDKSERGDHHRR